MSGKFLTIVLIIGTFVPIMRTPKPKGNVVAALFNRTCVLLLSLLYNNTEKTFYLREIARKIHMGTGTVQRELSRLVDADLVVRQKDGRQVYYGANRKSYVYNEIRGLVIKTFGLVDIIRDTLDPVSRKIGCAFIYGSQADGTAATDSDVDIMVVGRVDEMDLHRAVSKGERNLSKAINYSLITAEEFERGKKEKGGFINRIAAGRKIMLIGDESEIR